MTGDTAKGRSMMVISRLLPANSNLAMAQAAAMPKSVLSGTTMTATSSVSCTAARVSVSAKMATAWGRPRPRAVPKMTASGANSSPPRNVSASAMKVQRSSAARSPPRPGRRRISAWSVVAMPGIVSGPPSGAGGSRPARC
jgi:hypothetical protein